MNALIYTTKPTTFSYIRHKNHRNPPLYVTIFNLSGSDTDRGLEALRWTGDIRVQPAQVSALGRGRPGWASGMMDCTESSECRLPSSPHLRCPGKWHGHNGLSVRALAHWSYSLLSKRRGTGSDMHCSVQSGQRFINRITAYFHSAHGTSQNGICGRFGRVLHCRGPGLCRSQRQPGLHDLLAFRVAAPLDRASPSSSTSRTNRQNSRRHSSSSGR